MKSKRVQKILAESTLLHARWHCMHGSNNDGTERTPDEGDKLAAEILRKLILRLKGV